VSRLFPMFSFNEICRMSEAEWARRCSHNLDYGKVDEVDEIDGDEVCVLIWCCTHKTWGWHWVPREQVGL
jgi:hypothetical protein